MIPLKKNKTNLIKKLCALISVSLAIAFLLASSGLYAAALTIDCTVNDIRLVNMPVNAYMVKNKTGRVVKPYSDYNIDYILLRQKKPVTSPTHWKLIRFIIL